ncbi:MAG: hypothetical protein H0U87_10540 [Acidobacteria bacterium]|nr:hypothetical protein [Acidobacteriota bacterium]
MNENTVIITERDGKYEIQNNGVSEFALLGILECIIFDMKSAGRQHAHSEPKKQDAVREEAFIKKQTIDAEPKQTESETKGEAAPTPNTSDLRTRIGNAVKAIKALGGKTEDADLSRLTDEDLQSELEALTDSVQTIKNFKKCEVNKKIFYLQRAEE